MDTNARGAQDQAIRIELLLAAPHHRYEGRPADGALPLAPGEDELREQIELRAGLGIVGDRYFGKPAHRQASVTFFAAEALESVAHELGLEHLPVAATRRNIVVRGLDVDSLRGVRFSVDSGHGPVGFVANRPANPCAWMDRELAPGVFKAMRGRGGMRCEPLTDGILRLGPAVVRLEATL
ncbi:MOSC domain-containing protein [Frondihabitans peucedani]|uniref:MOSC domain-containing protein n=1 Tax=Frondihabitans peucedani TaxID=598626 RepID=A0ABP8E0X7_9MICO